MFNRPMNNFQGGMQQPARFPQQGGMGQQFPQQGFRPQGGMQQPQFPQRGMPPQMQGGPQWQPNFAQPSMQPNPSRQMNPQMMQQLQQGLNTLSGQQQMPQAFNTMMPNNPFAGLNGFGGGY